MLNLKLHTQTTFGLNKFTSLLSFTQSFKWLGSICYQYWNENNLLFIVKLKRHGSYDYERRNDFFKNWLLKIYFETLNGLKMKNNRKHLLNQNRNKKLLYHYKYFLNINKINFS